MLDLTAPRTLGGILDECRALYGSHFRVFAVIALVVVAPLDLLTLGIFDGYLTSGFDWEDIGSGGIANSLVNIFVSLPLITAACIHAVKEIAGSQTPSARRSLEAAGAVFVPLLATVFIVALGIIGGLILLIVPGIYWGVKWVVAAQSVVAEELDPTAAMRRSWHLVDGQWWRVFGITIMLNIVGGVIAALLGLPLSVLAAALDIGALNVLGSIIFDSIGYSFAALSATLLYYDLRARKDGGAPDAAPGPA